MDEISVVTSVQDGGRPAITSLDQLEAFDAPIRSNIAQDAAEVVAHNQKHLLDKVRQSENNQIAKRWASVPGFDAKDYRVGLEIQLEGRVFMVTEQWPPNEYVTEWRVQLAEVI